MRLKSYSSTNSMGISRMLKAIADSVHDPAAVAVDQCMHDVLGYTKPWIGQPSFGWFSISTWSHCFGISSGQSDSDNDNDNDDNDNIFGDHQKDIVESYSCTPLQSFRVLLGPFCVECLNNCQKPLSTTPLDPIKAKYIMGKLSLHNHSINSIKNLKIFNIFTYPPLQSFRVLLGPATCITFRSFLVLDEVGSTLPKSRLTIWCLFA